MATQILLRNVTFWVGGILFFADNYVTYIRCEIYTKFQVTLMVCILTQLITTCNYSVSVASCGYKPSDSQSEPNSVKRKY